MAAALIPGGALAFVLRARGLAFFALAGPLSVALISLTAILSDLVRAPFGWVTVLITSGLICAATWLIVRRFRPEGVGSWNATVLIVAVGAVLAGFLIFASSVAGLPSFDVVDQSYDGVFHANAVASILQGESASSLRLYAISHPGPGLEFYPAGWHDLVALVSWGSGASIGTSTVTTWLVVAVAMWVPGIVWLTATVTGTERPALLLAAAVAAGSFAAFPSLLLDWGVLYPTFLAYAILPAGLALAVIILRRLFTSGTSSPPIAITVVWAIAAISAHPRSLFTGAVILIPFVAHECKKWITFRLKDPVTRRRTRVQVSFAVITALALAALTVIIVLRFYGIGSRPISDRLNGGPATATQDLLTSAWQVLAQAPITPQGQLAPGYLLGIIVLAGLVICFATPQIRWVAISYLLLAILYCLAAGSNSDIAKLATGLWYKDKYRLMAALPILAAPVAAITVDTAWRLARRGAVRWQKFTLAAGLLVCAVTLAVSPTLVNIRHGITSSFEVTKGPKDGKLLDSSELALLKELPRYVPAGQRLLGDPWNGSVASWSVDGIEPVFPHFVGSWDLDRRLLEQFFSNAPYDPTICQALSRLNVHYVFYSDGIMANGGAEAAAFQNIESVRGNPAIMRLVAQRGGSALYVITACN